jgi:hypothetical protein
MLREKGYCNEKAPADKADLSNMPGNVSPNSGYMRMQEDQRIIHAPAPSCEDMR